MSIAEALISLDRILSKSTYKGPKDPKGPLARLARSYLDARALGAPIDSSKGLKTSPLETGRPIVFFTSGKDSMHLALFLKKRSPYLVYIDGLNRSESFYEKKTAKAFASRFGFDLIFLKIPKALKRNRSGHNIGLRDQIIVATAYPEIKKLGVREVWFGVTHPVQPPELFTETALAHDLASSLYDHEFNVRFHFENGFSEMDIMKDFVEGDLLRYTSSCYAQPNFREHKHKLLKNKFPNQQIYHGCGSCVKCLRINGAIVAFDENVSPAFQAFWLRKTRNHEDDVIKSLRWYIFKGKKTHI